MASGKYHVQKTQAEIWESSINKLGIKAICYKNRNKPKRIPEKETPEQLGKDKRD